MAGHTFNRGLLGLLLAAAVTAVGLVAVPTSAAQAAGPCGSSYTLVFSHREHNQGTGWLQMELAVYWSSTSKRNCLVVNHLGQSYGTSMYTLAKIRPSGYSWPACPSTGCDEGDYRYYAGPVYTPAGLNMSGRCVDVAGMVGVQADRIKYNIACG
ncbi:hypothetical protein [Micromonospora zamorensis]|uniref:hypothetical protein n=1 Tax=Micromonospora zamorensis TaxID=709883 RepID=UPI003CF9D997